MDETKSTPQRRYRQYSKMLLLWVSIIMLATTTLLTLYLAAGQEVFDEAKHLGIAPEFLMQVGRTPIGMTMAFNKMDDELSFIRRNGGEAQPAEASPKT